MYPKSHQFVMHIYIYMAVTVNIECPFKVGLLDLKAYNVFNCFSEYIHIHFCTKLHCHCLNGYCIL